MSFSPVDPRIESYLKSLAEKHDDPVLLDMEARAMEHDFPIVGRLCGAFLEVMALTIGARTVFEMGSGYGYSAWWFTRAVGPGGHVHCTDGSAANRALAEDYLTRAGRWDRVSYHTGYAQDILQETTGAFDLIYCDVDKEQYPGAWELAKDRIRPGGLYICDNVLWSGRVTDEAFDSRPDTIAIQQQNAMIFADPEFDAFIHPVRDGLIVARRKA